MQDGNLNDAQNRKAVATIIRSSETQNRLIEDLLDVARLISGKLNLKRDDLALSEIVGHSVESLRPLAHSKGIEILFEDRDGQGRCPVFGDRDRLIQVFSNLVENAIKFTPGGGKIYVNVEPCGDDSAKVTVKDEGTGISETFLPSVFERFRQDSVPGAVNGGLGLGLAIVRNLVEMHGGSVSVSSEGEGKGSEFTVTLPLAGTENTDLAANDLSDDIHQSFSDMGRSPAQRTEML
jgi:signal transduction histidine kinase